MLLLWPPHNAAVYPTTTTNSLTSPPPSALYATVYRSTYAMNVSLLSWTLYSRFGYLLFIWNLQHNNYWVKRAQFHTNTELTTLRMSLRGLCLTPVPIQDSLCHPVDHCSLQAAWSRLERKMPCLDGGRLTLSQNKSYLFCMLIYSLSLHVKKKTVSFRKFVIKALRSMIMAFVLVFVIFAKATVVEFPQIYLYTSAVSGV